MKIHPNSEKSGGTTDCSGVPDFLHPNIDAETIEKLQMLAEKRGKTLAELTEELVEKAIDGERVYLYLSGTPIAQTREDLRSQRAAATGRLFSL